MAARPSRQLLQLWCRPIGVASEFCSSFSTLQEKERDASPSSSTFVSASPPSQSGGRSSLVKAKLEGFKLQLPPSPFAPPKRGPAGPKMVLYRGRGMLWFRFFVRAKVFQLAGVLTAATLCSTVMSPDPNVLDIAAAGALALGCLVTSYCVWYYSGRYVGELSLLLPEKNVARFSVLDFWGNRQDNDVAVASIDPPFRNRSVAEVKAMVQPVLMPINVIGDRQYYISVGHGNILEKEVLLGIMYGKPLEDFPALRKQEAAVHPIDGGDARSGLQAQASSETQAVTTAAEGAGKTGKGLF